MNDDGIRAELFSLSLLLVRLPCVCVYMLCMHVYFHLVSCVSTIVCLFVYCNCLELAIRLFAAIVPYHDVVSVFIVFLQRFTTVVHFVFIVIISYFHTNLNDHTMEKDSLRQDACQLPCHAMLCRTTIILHTIGIHTHSNTLHEFLQFDGFSSCVSFSIICTVGFRSVCYSDVVLFSACCWWCVCLICNCCCDCSCCCCCRCCRRCWYCCHMRQKEIGDRFLCLSRRRSIEQILCIKAWKFQRIVSVTFLYSKQYYKQFNTDHLNQDKKNQTNQNVQVGR